MQEIASLIQNYFCDGKTGRVQSGIVYCLSQRDCDDTADKLSSLVRGLTVKPYHAGLDNRVRAQTQQEWIQDKVRHGSCVFVSFDKSITLLGPNGLVTHSKGITKLQFTGPSRVRHHCLRDGY